MWQEIWPGRSHNWVAQQPNYGLQGDNLLNGRTFWLKTKDNLITGTTNPGPVNINVSFKTRTAAECSILEPSSELIQKTNSLIRSENIEYGQDN